MTLPLYPSYLRKQADALLEDLATEPELLDRLHSDPVSALGDWPGLALEWEGRYRGDSVCSVDGWYSRVDQTVHLVRGGNAERLNFTACHELGHHLQRQHPQVAAALAQYHEQDPQRRLEDRICDTFASRVLIPDDAMLEVDRLGPTAADVIAMYEHTQASRAACVVRAADLLRHEGWVILASSDGEILFAAAAHHEFRLRPGTSQPTDSLITKAGAVGSAQGLGSVTYPSGKASPQFNTDAQSHDGYVFAVMSVGATPWSPGPVADRDRWARPSEFECASASCGATFTQYERSCQTCEQPICPDCNRCRCSTLATSRLCHTCFLQRPVTEMPEGSNVCIPCLEEGR